VLRLLADLRGFGRSEGIPADFPLIRPESPQNASAEGLELRGDALNRVTGHGVQPDNEEVVLSVTEPQVWVLIGVFAAAIGSMITLVIMTMNAKFKAVEVKFDLVIDRLDRLDGDVNALMKREFGIDRS